MTDLFSATLAFGFDILSSVPQLFRTRNDMLWRTCVGVGILFQQQLTGINAVFYFAPVIFATFLSTNLALLCNILLTAVNFLW